MWKGFVAFSANKRPFSSVYQHVSLQMFRSMKRFDAFDKIITLFSSMNQAVYFQSLCKTKCLIASSSCVIFQHCGLTCEFSSAPPDGIFYCIQHKCPAFPHYVSACDPLDGVCLNSLLHSTIYTVSLHCDSSCDLSYVHHYVWRIFDTCDVFTHYE